MKQKQNKLTEEKKASKIGSKSKTTESAKIANAAENPGTKSTHKSNSQSTHSPAVETSNNNHNNYVEDEADPKIRLKSYSSILRKNAKFNGHPEGEATPNKYQTWTQRAVKLKAKETTRTAEEEEKESPIQDTIAIGAMRKSPRFQVQNTDSDSSNTGSDSNEEGDEEQDEQLYGRQTRRDPRKPEAKIEMDEELSEISAISKVDDDFESIGSPEIIDTTFGSDNPDDDDTADLIAATRNSILVQERQANANKKQKQNTNPKATSLTRPHAKHKNNKPTANNNGDIHAITPIQKDPQTPPQSEIAKANENEEEEKLEESEQMSESSELSPSSQDSVENHMEISGTENSETEADLSMLTPKQLEQVLDKHTDETQFQPVINKATKKQKTKK